ncbi:MAG: transferase hexapeptide repeat family protein [Flavobacteriales bacterium]|jgi:carbonic anhydrase/acetyltransferase-like protein (isoleucine patch superfamily)
MANIFEFKGFKPIIHESAYIHENATVTGNVTIGKDVYVGPGAAIRGDWGGIVIKDGCNIQENVTLHMFPGVIMVLEENSHIGHGAVVHGAHIGRNSLVGMNSVIMDNVDLGEECVVGALSFVKAGAIVPRRSLIVGNPAKVVKQLDDEFFAWKTKGTNLYQSLPEDCRKSMKPCEPLREMPADRPAQESLYETWDSIK